MLALDYPLARKRHLTGLLTLPPKFEHCALAVAAANTVVAAPISGRAHPPSAHLALPPQRRGLCLAIRWTPPPNTPPTHDASQTTRYFHQSPARQGHCVVVHPTPNAHPPLAPNVRLR